MTTPIEWIWVITRENVSQKLAWITTEEKQIILEELQKTEKPIVSDQIDKEISQSELESKILAENNSVKIHVLNIMKQEDMCTIDNLKKLIDIKIDSDAILFDDLKISKHNISWWTGSKVLWETYYNSNAVWLPWIKLPSKKDFQKIISSLPTKNNWSNEEDSWESLLAIILWLNISGSLYKDVLINTDRGWFWFLRWSDCIIKFYETSEDGIVYYNIFDDSGSVGLNSYPCRSIEKK